MDLGAGPCLLREGGWQGFEATLLLLGGYRGGRAWGRLGLSLGRLGGAGLVWQTAPGQVPRLMIPLLAVPWTGAALRLAPRLALQAELAVGLGSIRKRSGGRDLLLWLPAGRLAWL